MVVVVGGEILGVLVFGRPRNLTLINPSVGITVEEEGVRRTTVATVRSSTVGALAKMKAAVVKVAARRTAPANLLFSFSAGDAGDRTDSSRRDSGEDLAAGCLCFLRSWGCRCRGVLGLDAGRAGSGGEAGWGSAMPVTALEAGPERLRIINAAVQFRMWTT